jgi:hypothetical protein
MQTLQRSEAVQAGRNHAQVMSQSCIYATIVMAGTVDTAMRPPEENEP